MAKKQSARATKQPEQKKGSRQLVLTFNASNGEIEKIEEMGTAGKRRALSETELAALGDEGVEDLCTALEAAYLAGIKDGFHDAQIEDLSGGEFHDRSAAHESIGEDVLRFGIRRVILRQALRRKAVHSHAKVPGNGAHGAHR
jgi:hypothetical protein